ncbi:MAG: hypothetical protein ACI8UR_000718 [Natronomonas sp.]|jgi:hypothetical protein|uniref:hypothetical protein n=1 Tax=Natronomonas sp. TaxID=2184060 RepID=UPI003989D810
MLNLNIDDFMVELKDGSISNVGAPNKSATAKLFDISTAEARAFGDSQVKIVAEDDGNEVQIALSALQATSIADDIERLQEESPVFE